jgi:type II secretory pathway pseudopilin PulG
LRDTRRQLDIRQIQTAIQLYYEDYKKYPSVLNDLSPIYLSYKPTDPLTKESYQCLPQQDGKDYKLCAQMELLKNQKCITSADNSL